MQVGAGVAVGVIAGQVVPVIHNDADPGLLGPTPYVHDVLPSILCMVKSV